MQEKNAKSHNSDKHINVLGNKKANYQAQFNPTASKHQSVTGLRIPRGAEEGFGA